MKLLIVNIVDSSICPGLPSIRPASTNAPKVREALRASEFEPGDRAVIVDLASFEKLQAAQTKLDSLEGEW